MIQAQTPPPPPCGTAPVCTWTLNGWFNNIAPQPAGNNEVVFVAPYNSTGSLFACSVSVLGNIVVTFNPGHTLYCVNSLFVQNSNIGENARLIFENGASLVQTNPFAVNTGSIEYRRNTNLETTYDFTYFCSPVRDQMLLTIDRIVENMDAINGNLSGTGTAVTAPLGSNPYQTTFFDKYFDWINEGVPNRPTTQFTFNSMGQQTNWHWNVASTTNMNPAGKGFNIRAPKSFQEAAGPLPYLTNFIGVPNNGDVSIAVQGQPYPIANDLNNSSGSCAYPLFTDKTTNLIGNPYPSAIDADSFLMTNFDLIDYPLRFWSHNTQVSSLNPGGVNGQIFAYNNDDFALYTLLGGIATQRYFNLGPASAVVNTNRPTGKITACQGFFAHTIANGNINFDNTMRDGAGNNKSGQGGSFYRTAAPAMIGSLEKNRIWLSIEEVDPQSTILKYREILVGYMPNSQATNAYDKNFDAYKFTNAPQFNLYSLTNSNNNCYPLAIQARAQGTTFDVNDVIPLGYRCNAGTFIIRAATVDGIFGGSTPAQKFWLREKITVSGIITFNYYDLKTTPFNLNLTISMTADNTDQFAIVFS
ncbi:MAG: hypothetical protein H7174_06655 [Flavobacterium sp.]|nr:hypothetical protein [Flavobacterium sp.]